MIDVISDVYVLVYNMTVVYWFLTGLPCVLDIVLLYTAMFMFKCTEYLLALWRKEGKRPKSSVTEVAKRVERSRDIDCWWTQSNFFYIPIHITLVAIAL